MNRSGVVQLAIIAILAALALLMIGPIAQDPAYHAFADTRAAADIANAGNVLSNLPFLLVGVWGLWRGQYLPAEVPRAAYRVFCLGVAAVAFGSAWYHLAPDNASLLWDRLPMTVAFMALLSLLIEERVWSAASGRTLWPLLLAGITSALYWYWTESRGAGDLRPYVLVQFLPLLMIPLLLWRHPPRFTVNKRIWQALGLYALAKLFEHFDAAILQALGGVSGHSLKHVAAAMAVASLVAAIPTVRRDPV
ncbi:MAG TPA: ceramidase domain-containing protein [Arenimonas sp.]|nr:ceramidase domain-containing protein [Arenimonas sp.]